MRKKCEAQARLSDSDDPLDFLPTPHQRKALLCDRRGQRSTVIVNRVDGGRRIAIIHPGCHRSACHPALFDKVATQDRSFGLPGGGNVRPHWLAGSTVPCESSRASQHALVNVENLWATFHWKVGLGCRRSQTIASSDRSFAGRRRRRLVQFAQASGVSEKFFSQFITCTSVDVILKTVCYHAEIRSVFGVAIENAAMTLSGRISA